MTTSTPHTKILARVRGFTLTEVIVVATLSSFLMAGVLSAFLMIGRTGFLASSYSELEAETRRGLEIFGSDARKASDIHWNTAQSVTLTVVTATNATVQVTYAYDSGARYFYRLDGAASSTLPRRVLIHNVAPDFAFHRYKLETSGSTDNTASTDGETKQLEVAIHAYRGGNGLIAANQTSLSARYILRGKRVAN